MNYTLTKLWKMARITVTQADNLVKLSTVETRLTNMSISLIASQEDLAKLIHRMRAARTRDAETFDSMPMNVVGIQGFNMRGLQNVTFAQFTAVWLCIKQEAK